MFDLLKTKITSYISLEPDELDLLDGYFEHRVLKRKEMLLGEGEICKFIAFIDSGTIRHYHTKNGNEKTWIFPLPVPGLPIFRVSIRVRRVL